MQSKVMSGFFLPEELQLTILPIVDNLCVSSSVLAPVRAAAQAASVPA